MSNDPLGSFSQEFAVRLECPRRDLYCNIPLPHQSPLGIYEGQRYRPTGEWPATFLCLRHGRSFECFPDSVHLEAETRVPNQPVPPLWRIGCVCGHENCGRQHAIYTARMPSGLEIVRRILITNPNVPCDGHPFEWREDLMRPIEIAHEPPVR